MNKQNVMYTYSGNYSAYEGKEIMTQATTWMNLKDIMLSKQSHLQKGQYCKTPFIQMIHGNQNQRNTKKGGYQGLGGRMEEELVFCEYSSKSYYKMEKFWISVAQQCEYT